MTLSEPTSVEICPRPSISCVRTHIGDEETYQTRLNVNDILRHKENQRAFFAAYPLAYFTISISLIGFPRPPANFKSVLAMFIRISCHTDTRTNVRFASIISHPGTLRSVIPLYLPSSTT